MSARFFKIFSVVVIAHLIVLNAVWVGFSAPLPRPPAVFTYEGALPAEDTASSAEDVFQADKTPVQFDLDHFEAADLNHWVALRDPSKTTAYDHLGF